MCSLLWIPNPKRILIIGGVGDGYALAEVLKHESVEHVDHVDLDKDAIETYEERFPQWATHWVEGSSSQVAR